MRAALQADTFLVGMTGGKTLEQIDTEKKSLRGPGGVGGRGERGVNTQNKSVLHKLRIQPVTDRQIILRSNGQLRNRAI